VKPASILLAVLILVGAPVGVGVVAHETAHHHRQLSPQAVAARQLIAKLQRQGATNITCSWTGSGSVAAVSCTGETGNGTASTLYDLGSFPDTLRVSPSSSR
jgi:hypothetical protein